MELFPYIINNHPLYPKYLFAVMDQQINGTLKGYLPKCKLNEYLRLLNINPINIQFIYNKILKTTFNYHTIKQFLIDYNLYPIQVHSSDLSFKISDDFIHRRFPDIDDLYDPVGCSDNNLPCGIPVGFSDNNQQCVGLFFV